MRNAQSYEQMKQQQNLLNKLSETKQPNDVSKYGEKPKLYAKLVHYIDFY